MKNIRLPSGADARIVEWFDTDEFQASFCFEPNVRSVPQMHAVTWRTQADTLLYGLSASFGGFFNDLDVVFELEFVGGRVPPYRVPLFAANGRPFAVPLIVQEGAEFTLRALTNVVFAKTCVIKAMLTAAVGAVRHVPRGQTCTCDAEHLARYPGVHLSACPIFQMNG